MEQHSTYTDRELQFHFDTINDKLDAILEQTKRTNGRVTKAEGEISNLKTSGRIANWAFGITIPVIVAMGVWIFFNQIQSIHNELNAHEEGDKAKWEIVFKSLNLK